MDATTLLADFRLIPVVVIDEPDRAVPLAKSLMAAGINAIEITLRTPAAAAAIEKVATNVPGMLVGAGSIRRPEQFADVSRAGAHFAVSPGWTATLVEAASLPWVPGAATASDCLSLLSHGYLTQKFFPAEPLGGVTTIKALAAPLPEVRFCPTGGITPALAPDYFALECVAAVGGSWFVPRDMIHRGEFDAIEDQARQALTMSRV